MKRTSPLFLALTVFLTGCFGKGDPQVNPSVHTFYYGWYGSAAVDDSERHWNHQVLGVDDAPPWPGGDDIGANFYPELGAYSSNDRDVVRAHLNMMEQAGIGVLVASWWGPGSFEDDNLALLFEEAARTEVTIAFHLEPIPGRGPDTSRDWLVYLLDRYGDHPALHRSSAFRDRPIVYIYDSYHTPADQWRRLLHPEGDLTIRGTEYDAAFIGLWVVENEEEYFLDGAFDGFYTYFGSDGFTWGSTTANWKTLASWAATNDLAFIPCVGPGYLDTRVRPWNAATTRSREEGAAYDRAFTAAIAVSPTIIGITSFNEWHEGTQIEPAVPLAIEDFTYEDYAPLPPDHYLRRTRYWADRFSPGR